MSATEGTDAASSTSSISSTSTSTSTGGLEIDCSCSRAALVCESFEDNWAVGDPPWSPHGLDVIMPTADASVALCEETSLRTAVNIGDQASLLSSRPAPGADTVNLAPYELHGWARLSSSCTDPDIRVAVLHFIPDGGYSYGLELWVRDSRWSLDVITLQSLHAHPTNQPATLDEWHEFRITMDATDTTLDPGDPPPEIRLQIDDVVDDMVDGNQEANDLREAEIILGVTGPLNPKSVPLTRPCSINFDQVVFEPVDGG